MSEVLREAPKQEPPRDVWSKAQALATIFATAAVPLILAYAGYVFNDSLKDRDVKLRTTELAIAILREDPKENPETPLLREWAAEVIDSYSGIEFPEGTKQELKLHPLTFSAYLDWPFTAMEMGEPGGLLSTAMSLNTISSTQAALSALGLGRTLSCDEVTSSEFDRVAVLNQYAEELRSEARQMLSRLILACRRFE